MKTKSASILVLAFALALTGCANIEQHKVEQAAAQTEVQQLTAAHGRVLDSSRTIVLISHYATWPNSAGGVGVEITFQNCSDKTIKYARFTVTPINRVGDIAASEIRGESTVTLSATGPFAPNVLPAGAKMWENVWYNSTISFVRLDKVSLEYMDGTKDEIEGAALAAIQIRPENNIFSSGIQQSRHVGVSDGKLHLWPIRQYAQ